MQRHRLGFIGLCVGLSVIACGSSQRAGAAPVAGSAGAVVEMSANGEPGWIRRGSGAIKNDGGRVFYGVGSASGVKNPALLRNTADNRARAELAKIFETFSASLMKDYSNSDGQQNIEQAVKTFSAMSLEGVSVVDRYTGADGTLYALAALDAAKMAPILQKAKESGLVKSAVEPVKVDDIFDAHAKKEAPEEIAPSSVAAGQPAPNAAPADSGAAPMHRGGRPAWVDGADSRFPNAAYLCAVGMAAERSAAENAGYAAMSRIFVARVASTSRDFMGAYSKTGAADLQVQSTEALTQVATVGVLQGARVMEAYQDSAAGQIDALVCLERAKIGAILRQQIDADDKKAAGFLEGAAALDKAGKIKQLSRAMDTLLLREAANTQLRIVDTQGIGVRGPYSPADVANALEAAVEALRVGVRTDGPYNDDFRAALIAGLTSRGYHVADLAGQAALAEIDVLVSATVHVEDGGSGTGTAANTYFARGVVAVEVKNVAQGTVLASFNESRKEGSRSKEEAERRAVRNLAGKISNEVSGKIDSTMRGQ